MAAMQKIVQLGRALLQAAGTKLAPHARRAVERICLCHTAALGGHVQECPEGHFEKNHYNGCKHRSCPECNFTSIERWLDKQKARLLNCDYYHVIFTIPHELNSLWQANVSAMTDLLFHAVRDTLFEFLADKKHLGAEPGVIMGLHTWGQMCWLHPHCHCLVTGGGLTSNGEWRAISNGYLLPGRAVRDKFRGKMCYVIHHALEKGKLVIPEGVRRQQLLNLLNKLGRKKWNVRIQDRYAHGNGVLTYLARYMRGGPISNRRIVSFDEEKVLFRYKDYHAAETGGKKYKKLELTNGDFLQRLLLHVPEPGRKVVRSYGLYAGSRRKDLDRCREMLGQEPVQEPEVRDWQECMAKFGDKDHSRCPVCGARLVKQRLIAPDFWGMARKYPLLEAA